MEQFLRLSLYKKYLEMPQETHNIPHSIFLHNYVKILTKNVILPRKISILCDIYKTDPKIVYKYRATRNF